MNQQQQLINKLLSEGYDFHIGQYIREGFAIFKQNIASFIGFMVVLFGISMVANFIPILGPLAYYFILSPVLAVGYYFVADKIARNQATEFGDFFDGFKHFAQLALLNLVMIGILLLVFTPTLYALYNSGVIEWYMDILNDPTNPPTDLPPFDSTTGIIVLLNLHSGLVSNRGLYLGGSICYFLWNEFLGSLGKQPSSDY